MKSRQRGLAKFLEPIWTGATENGRLAGVSGANVSTGIMQKHSSAAGNIECCKAGFTAQKGLGHVAGDGVVLEVWTGSSKVSSDAHPRQQDWKPDSFSA